MTDFDTKQNTKATQKTTTNENEENQALPPDPLPEIILSPETILSSGILRAIDNIQFTETTEPEEPEENTSPSTLTTINTTSGTENTNNIKITVQIIDTDTTKENGNGENSKNIRGMLTIASSILMSTLIGIFIGIEITTRNPQLAKTTQRIIELATVFF